jgi:hypothetical protein
MATSDRLRRSVIGEESERPLPAVGRTRLEQACFIEGAAWILRMLTTYRIDWKLGGSESAEISADTMQHVREEAGRRYPNHDE